MRERERVKLTFQGGSVGQRATLTRGVTAHLWEQVRERESPQTSSQSRERRKSHEDALSGALHRIFQR